MALFGKNPYSCFFSLARGPGRVELATAALFAYLVVIAPVSAAEMSFASQLRYEEAQGLMSRQKWPEAVLALRSILEDEPGRLAVVTDLAKALAYSGRREEALALLVQAVERQKTGTRNSVAREGLVRRVNVLSRVFFRNDDFQLYQEGVNLLQARKYGSARDRFQSIMTREGTNVEVLTRIGQAYVLESDFDSAAERLRFAKKLNPYEPEIRLWLGRALHRRGELKEALEELKLAARDLKTSELAPLWLSEVLVESGQRAQAIKFLEQDVNANPYHLQVLTLLAKLRTAQSARDQQVIWSARKELQLALSRFEEYGRGKWLQCEGELGLNFGNPDDLQKEIRTLLQRVETKLQDKTAT